MTGRYRICKLGTIVLQEISAGLVWSVLLYRFGDSNVVSVKTSRQRSLSYKEALLFKPPEVTQGGVKT